MKKSTSKNIFGIVCSSQFFCWAPAGWYKLTLWKFAKPCGVSPFSASYMNTLNQTKIYLESRLELQLWCVSRFPIQPIWIQSRTLLTTITKYHNSFFQYCLTLTKSRIPVCLEKLWNVSVHFKWKNAKERPILYEK